LRDGNRMDRHSFSNVIVTKADAQGNRYILLSTTGSQKYNHVAKLVKQTAAATEKADERGKGCIIRLLIVL
jgi:hypothetical protein